MTEIDNTLEERENWDEFRRKGYLPPNVEEMNSQIRAIEAEEEDRLTNNLVMLIVKMRKFDVKCRYIIGRKIRKNPLYGSYGDCYVVRLAERLKEKGVRGFCAAELYAFIKLAKLIDEDKNQEVMGWLD